MKKTFTINISGTIFHIEEDAYEKLQGYLIKLKNHFGNETEGREIVADIETRICELFIEKSKGETKVVVIEWVDEVIATMGTPEDFIKEEGNEEPLPGGFKGKRRLYRDTDNKVIGGVCSGLGAYFKMDPVIVRIIFVVLFLFNGIGLIAYLVLWIAVPKAQTTAQRLEMRGEEVNISNIERTVRDEGSESKGGAQKTDSGGKRSSGSGVSDGVKGLLKATVIAIGIFLILFGFTGLLAFISSLVVGQSFLSDWPLAWNHGFHMSGLLSQFVSHSTVTWGLLCVGFLVGIPLLAILYIGTKLVFGYKSNNTAIGLGMAGIWLAALIGIVVVSTLELQNFKDSSSLSGTETLYPAAGKTFRIKLAADKYSNYSDLNWDIDRFKAVSVDGRSLLLGEPRLDIEKSTTNDCVIIVKKQSRGRSREQTNGNIQHIIYHYQISDSVLTFDPWFLIGENGKWRNQKVNITLRIPEGMAIYLDEGMDKIIYNISNVSNTWDHDMIGKTWVMQPEGLTMKDSLNVKKINKI